MQREVVPFEFQNKAVRVVNDERGEPLFVGADVCEALGYANTADALKRHCKGVVKRYPLQTEGGVQEMRVLSEPDVMRLLVHSKRPDAQAFERLVFEEILPSIRRTGSYSISGKSLTADVHAERLVGVFVHRRRLVTEFADPHEPKLRWLDPQVLEVDPKQRGWAGDLVQKISRDQVSELMHAAVERLV